MQKAYFPMDVINLTQGYGSSSGTHKLSYALDLAGKDGGADKVYAPFNCKITKLYQPKDTINHANTVWITSTEEVECANGYIGYLTMSITHPKEISKMKLGTTYKQGAVICTEGMTGRAGGNHIHLELAKGKTAGWSKKTSGSYTEYVITNKVKPEEYLFLKKGSTVKGDTYKGTKYKFIYETEVEPIDKYSKGRYIMDNPRYIRTGAGTEYSIKKVKDITANAKTKVVNTKSTANAQLKKGATFDVSEVKYASNKSIWGKIPSGWVCLESSTGTVYVKKG